MPNFFSVEIFLFNRPTVLEQELERNCFRDWIPFLHIWKYGSRYIQQDNGVLASCQGYEEQADSPCVPLFCPDCESDGCHGCKNVRGASSKIYKCHGSDMSEY